MSAPVNVASAAASSPPPADTVHELILLHARSAPAAVAVTGPGGPLTYRELDARSAQLAARLRDAGAAPEVPVAVRLPRSGDLVVAALAVLRAGAAWVPIDPAEPAARLRLVLADSGAVVVVGAADDAALPPEATVLPVLPATGDAPTGREAALPGVAPHHLAYIAYTSGSTGTPKGVMIEHRAAVNTLWHLGTAWRLGAEDVALQLARPGYSAAVRDLLGPLVHGATVHLLTDRQLLSPGDLADRLAGGVTCVPSCLPGVLQAILDAGPAVGRPAAPGRLRLVNVISEPLPPALLIRARRSWGPGVRLVHQYGLTECAMTSLCWSCDGAGEDGAGEVNPGEWPGDRLPVGTPIPGTTVHLLDARGRPVPDGAVGELYVGGIGLARGYLNRPELTAERFVCGPTGARLFRTGDLARRRRDGNYVVTGRLDDQVKVSGGFRVELGEVEAVLRLHPAVRAAAVALQDGELVAHVVPATPAAPEASALAAFVAGRLPRHMVPARLSLLDALPLTANGKLDRRALPAADRRRTPSTAPRTPLEREIAALWGEVLGLDRVGRHDDVVELGADSLHVLQMAARVKSRLGVPIGVAEVFAHRTVAGLAASVEAAADVGMPATAASDSSAAPGPPGALSPAQRRLWFMEQLAPGSPVYTVPAAWRLRGPLDVVALRGAVDHLVRRHDVLRTVFTGSAAAPAALVRDDLRVTVDVVAAPPDLDAFLAAAVRKPFDLRIGPLLRLVVVQTGADEHVLLLTAHHAVLDAGGRDVLLAELATTYGRLAVGRPPDLPPLAAQHAELAARKLAIEAGPEAAAAVDFWHRALAGAPETIALPLDRPRLPAHSRAGGVVSMAFPPGLASRLTRLARRERVTFAVLALAGWAALLSRWSGQDDLVIGVPVAGREGAAEERAVGCLMTLLPLRIDLSGGPTFRALVRRTSAAMAAALAHRRAPFDVLVQRLAPRRDPTRSPLFQVMIDIASEPAWSLPGLSAARLPVHTGTAKLDLSLTLHRTDPGPAEQVWGELEYDAGIFDRATVEALAGQAVALLADAEADPERPVALLRLGDVGDLAKGPALDVPQECLHDLVLRRAAVMPDAPAVCGAGGELTYRELDVRSARLAARLRELGAGPGTTIGICLPRSPEAVVAVLAVLRTGAAYAPLEPAHPPARTAALLARARAAACVALPGTPGLTVPAVAPDGGREPLTDSGPAPGSDAAVAAYFTSGSSGEPKCVRLSHRNWVNRVAAIAAAYPLGPGARVLHKTALSFDDAVVEIFWPLTVGGTVAVLGPGEERSPRAILDAVVRHRARYLFVVPSMLALLVGRAAADPAVLGGLHSVFASGETLTPELVRRYYEVAGAAGPQLVNHWGVTEAGIDSTVHQCTPADGRARQVPIGRPLPNVTVHILDPAGWPVPVGVVGELCVGGAGVGLGYLGDEALTRDRFRPDPFSGRHDAQLYHSGDLARRLPAGELEFLGRRDHQVKIRGHRIELGEVEAALQAQPGVRFAVVAVRPGRPVPGAGPPGDELVAYLMPAGPELRVAELRRSLATSLPAHLMPGAFVPMEALPVLPSGKVDRTALPSPAAVRPPLETAFTAPRDRVEQTLAAIWQDLLGLDRVGVRDDFFDLGGHSLRAVALQQRVEDAFDLRLPLCDLFEFTTIEALARCIAPAAP